MKDYSLRINVTLRAFTDDEAKRKVELLLREFPKVEDSYVTNHSLYNKTVREIVTKVK